jgi:hypothetical protein
MHIYTYIIINHFDIQISTYICKSIRKHICKYNQIKSKCAGHMQMVLIHFYHHI